MAATDPVTELDARYSDEGATATAWSDARRRLEDAKLYWLITMRADGRPHTTPLLAVWQGRALYFCTGPDEQKARNLDHSPSVAVTTGVNTWNDGLDVIVEGDAERVIGRDVLAMLASYIREKYHGDWDFTPAEDGFGHTDDSGDSHIARVYRVPAVKVLAFAKCPHGHATFRF